MFSPTRSSINSPRPQCLFPCLHPAISIRSGATRKSLNSANARKKAAGWSSKTKPGFSKYLRLQWTRRSHCLRLCGPSSVMSFSRLKTEPHSNWIPPMARSSLRTITGRSANWHGTFRNYLKH
jgi:hypothetical protein